MALKISIMFFYRKSYHPSGIFKVPGRTFESFFKFCKGLVDNVPGLISRLKVIWLWRIKLRFSYVSLCKVLGPSGRDCFGFRKLICQISKFQSVLFVSHKSIFFNFQ